MPSQRPSRRRSPAWPGRRWPGGRWWCGPLALALAAPGVHAAPFVPGGPVEADPPTGEAPAARAAEPLQGGGIQWRFAPWRVSGALAVEARTLRLEDGQRSTNLLQTGDVDFASHVWMPWFIQVRLGFGWVASRAGGGRDEANDAFGLTGRAALTVFPMSRFPFELRADVSDSRSRSDSGALNLGSDYRSQRVVATQSWRPERGNASVQVVLDHSTLETDTARDRLVSAGLTAQQQAGAHRLDFNATHTDHRHSDHDEHTTTSSLVARHGWLPSPALQLETMASWNETRLQGRDFDNGSDLRQISTFGTWRLGNGSNGANGVYGGRGAPLFTGSARWVQARTLGSDDAARAEAVNATLGCAQELGGGWRTALAGSANRLDSAGNDAQTSVGANATLAWTPIGLLFAGWRYAPSATLSAGGTRDTANGARQVVGLQLAHGVSQEFPLGAGAMLALGLTQSGGVLHESSTRPDASALAHGFNVAWQRLGETGSQTLAALSASDSRSFGGTRGRFQLVNLQLSQRVALSRWSSWSAAFTAQATRSETSELDVFSGERREQSLDWAPFYSGSASYEQQRVFGVPRLKFSLLLAATSQVIERRALGDIDAPRERVTESAEARLDYTIGKLDARLAARVARVEGRSVAAVQARAQRRF